MNIARVSEKGLEFSFARVDSHVKFSWLHSNLFVKLI